MESGSEKYRRFRKSYPAFIYHSCQTEETEEKLKVSYHFEIPGLAEFRPEWQFPKNAWYLEEGRGNTETKTALLMEMLFSLGMVELVSYWKLTCSPKVIIKAGKLCPDQIAWWKHLYFHGLGEFFYVNQIEEAQLENFMEMIAEEPEKDVPGAEKDKAPVYTAIDKSEKEAVYRGGCKGGYAQAKDADKLVQAGREDELVQIEDEDRLLMQAGREDRLVQAECRVLVPIGGGKDSAVTLELLKEAKADIWGYIINPRGATMKTAEAAGLQAGKVLSVHRTLDRAMLDLNQKGFLNGHTPFSALVAFSSLIMAALYEIPYIALSNESSANESTIQGSTVNHQYSKSFQFEKDFHTYAKQYLPGSAYYFSMLRPLSEFQIAGYFSGCKPYHAVFRSCNAGSKTDAWCGHCPKCLFVAAILSPFLSQEELKAIWGKNLFADESLWGTLEQLTGIQQEKPFECVGSRKEVNTALYLTVERLEREGKTLPVLLSRYRETAQYKAAQQLGDVFSDYFDEENLVPASWKELVRHRC